MNTNIWSSSQMAGTGGALKALAKNLANQLSLNRTEMKRVVARVISECHGQGHVGDYNGHMFYVKPERIDMTKQITHSKEAFDEMLRQKRMRAKNKMQRSPSGSRSLTYKLAVGDKPEKSLTGVSIDKNHLRPGGRPRDIVVEMSKPIIQIKSKQLIKSKPPPPPKSQLKRKSPAKVRPATLSKPKSLNKFQGQVKPKLAQLTKKKSIVKAERKTVKAKLSAAKSQQSRQTLQPAKPRLPAGDAVRSTVPVIKEAPKSKSDPSSRPRTPPSSAGTTLKKPGILKNKKSVKLTKTKSVNSCKNTLEEKGKKKPKRLTAGGGFPKTSRSVTSPAKRRELPPRRNSCQFQPSAGAIYRPNPVIAKLKGKPWTRPMPTGKNQKPVLSANSARRIRNMRSQARLAKDLERKEAIDDPERLEAGSMNLFRANESDPSVKRPKRVYKISARLLELAQPPPHRRFNPESAPIRSRSPIFRPKPKLRSRRRRRRVLVDSSLGSIEGLKATSRSGLSPAKRNLTLAFRNKEESRRPRSPRQKQSLLWR
ncbi:translation initiation factor IF-2 [Drosophila montana]|uniref:translation initiation factor IF-2 n=1 Tax=Drosophila montana TaxID=40370 RepID=UPI00313EA3AF